MAGLFYRIFYLQCNRDFPEKQHASQLFVIEMQPLSGLKHGLSCVMIMLVSCTYPAFIKDFSILVICRQQNNQAREKHEQRERNDY